MLWFSRFVVILYCGIGSLAKVDVQLRGNNVFEGANIGLFWARENPSELSSGPTTKKTTIYRGPLSLPKAYYRGRR